MIERPPVRIEAPEGVVGLVETNGKAHGAREKLPAGAGPAVVHHSIDAVGFGIGDVREGAGLRIEKAEAPWVAATNPPPCRKAKELM